MTARIRRGWMGCCAGAVMVLGAGCHSLGVHRAGCCPGAAAAEGVSVAHVLAAAGEMDARVEFFDADGAPLEGRVPGQLGSVSVHCPEGTGQDNYTYDEDGWITRQQRSYGEDYAAGVWQDVQ